MALLREALEEAIVKVKQSGRKVNTLLWSLYAWNESRSRIEGRVRGWLKDQVVGPGDTDSTVAGYGFAIWAESRMTGDNVHAVRKLFEEAVDYPCTRASVALWKRYVEFEIREREPTRAKLVLFRAMRCCPWSKGKIPRIILMKEGLTLLDRHCNASLHQTDACPWFQ